MSARWRAAASWTTSGAGTRRGDAEHDASTRACPTSAGGRRVGAGGRRAVAVVTASLALAISCHEGQVDQAAETSPELEDVGCLADDDAFVTRALLRVQGRAPRGRRETRLLASFVAQLDAAGLDGRRLLARGLTHDPRYELRWGTALEELLDVQRLGGRATPQCDATRHPAAERDALAQHVRDHDPSVAFPEPWGLGDLIASSLRLDDLTPLLRARVLTRMSSPVQGNNVTPGALERARRTHFGRGFEAAFLGRRGECLPCHNGEASVTDDPDPALDRFWAHPAALERAVYGAPGGRPEDEVHAAFRYAGFGDGWLAPWGADRCGLFAPGHDGDMLETPAYLGGAMPIGASALDVEARLRDGLELLRDEGPVAREATSLDGPRALATMVALHLVDGAWNEVAGAPLTMAHGFPRNRGQRDALIELSEVWIDSGFSLRALVVELVVHPALNQALPGACADQELGATPLPALFDPLAPDRDPEQPGNGLGDALHHHGPFALLDRASHALDWPTARRHPYPSAWEDEPLLRALGVRLSEIEPGARGLDWGALLMWESRMAEGLDPGFEGPAFAAIEGVAPGDTRDYVERLVAHARGQQATIGDVADALSDRLLGAPVPDDARGLYEALLETPWDTEVASLDETSALARARRVVGALLATPDFTIDGLVPETGADLPRLALPEDTTEALCERRAPALLTALDGAWSYRCGPEGVTLVHEGT